MCVDNTIKEEPIDIFDEHIEFDAQIKEENDEFSDRIERPCYDVLDESKDESRKRLRKKTANIDVKCKLYNYYITKLKIQPQSYSKIKKPLQRQSF